MSAGRGFGGVRHRAATGTALATQAAALQRGSSAAVPPRSGRRVSGIILGLTRGSSGPARGDHLWRAPVGPARAAGRPLNLFR